MLTWPDLVAYVGNVHARTYEAAALLEDGHLGWAPRPGEFTAGEVALHIANTRLMSVLAIEGKPMRYRGHTLGPAADAALLRQALLRSSKKTIARLHDADPAAFVRNTRGDEIPAWRLVLSGFVEHEVHHRSQLCAYLSALGLPAPALYGLHAEELPR